MAFGREQRCVGTSGAVVGEIFDEAGGRLIFLLLSALKFGDYLTTTLSLNSSPSVEIVSASLSPRGRGIEGEGAMLGREQKFLFTRP